MFVQSFPSSLQEALHGAVQDRKGFLPNTVFAELQKFMRGFEDPQYPKSFCLLQTEVTR